MVVDYAVNFSIFDEALFSASMAFLSGSQPEKRKLLSVYPIFLFYFVVSWIIVSHSSF